MEYGADKKEYNRNRAAKQERAKRKGATMKQAQSTIRETNLHTKGVLKTLNGKIAKDLAEKVVKTLTRKIAKDPAKKLTRDRAEKLAKDLTKVVIKTLTRKLAKEIAEKVAAT